MPQESTDHDYYVTKLNWLVTTGREDLVDEIADQFERPNRSGREAFWSRTVPGWPTRRSA